MQQFFQFLMNHWILVGLFILFLLLLLIEEARIKGIGRSGITPQLLTSLMNQDQVAIIDIRPSNAFMDGHIIQAINIPEETILSELKKIQKFKDKEIVIVDHNGQKSYQIANQLRKQGLEKVRILAGGMNAWKSANMPMVKK